MYLLVIRKQIFLFIGLILLSLGLVVFLPSHSADKAVKLPLLALLLGEIGLSFGVAVLCYQNAPPSQIFKAACTVLAVATGIGTIGNLTSPVDQMMPGAEVLISWIQLGIMNIGGFVTTYTLYDIQVAEASSQSTDRAATT